MVEITKEQLETMINNKESFIVDFYANWCGKCHSVAAMLEKYKDKVEIPIYKINIQDNLSLKEKYEVLQLPTIIAFKDGEEYKRYDNLSLSSFLKEFMKK